MSENKRCIYSDIAKEAGVPISTVSLVLRGMSLISDDIRERVLMSARLQGYQLQPFHPAIKKTGLNHIGLLIKLYQEESVVDNLFFAHITETYLIDSAFDRDDVLIIPVDPPLTSMSVDCAGLGRQAAMLLINRVQNPHSGLIKTTLTPNVVRPSIRRIELAGD